VPKRLSMADLSREQLIQRYAQCLKGVLDEIVPQSPNESDFRYRVNRVLDDFCEKLGFEIELRTEYGLAGKRADSVFNRFVVEYKRPGELGDSLAHPKTSKAVEQLKEYLRKLARDERQDLARIAGVVFDGCFLVFVRYRDGNFAVERPVPATQATLERLLTWLSSTASGIALTAENLTRDFGIEQPRTQRILRALFDGLNAALRPNAQNHPAKPMVDNLFRQWQTFFSQSIDYSEAFGGNKLKRLQKWAHKAGINIKSADEAKRLFFVMHTHFALLAKLLGYLAVSKLLTPKLGVSGLGSWVTDTTTLQERLRELESGGIFRHLGIVNLLEGDFFAWYRYTWDEEIENALREILKRLDEYDPTTLAVVPEETRDLFKQLYHYLLPREIRHNLGEYYTPDWLAMHMLQRTVPELFTEPTPETESELRQRILETRFLDPAWGSGTFLVLLVARLRELGRALPIDERDLLNAILQNVVGFDINPLAVLTARVNYLLAIADLLPFGRDNIVLPVYLADSIRTPAQGEGLFQHDAYTFPTAVGEFEIPAIFCHVGVFDRFCDVLEACVNAGMDADSFIQRVEKKLVPMRWTTEDAERVKCVYTELLKLHAEGLNGLWARLLKNNFAPLTVGQFDYIVGNPPWINWQHLPNAYRENTKDLWERYRLTGTYKGGRPRLGAVKVDIATLMTYVVMDTLLKDGGKLGFVITQSVFKTAAGAGFRRFELPEQNQQKRPIKVAHVDDMVALQPFENASNRTAVLVLQKGQSTEYPVPYTAWRRASGERFTYDSTLDEVRSATKQHPWHAEPVDPNDLTSQWLTAQSDALKAIRRVMGTADYKAHLGVNTGGANAVYWVERIRANPDGSVFVQNITEGAKTKVAHVQWTVEPDLLYPLLRGRDVQRWQATPSAWIIVPQDPKRPSRACPEKQLQTDYPKTYEYLKNFESELRNRSGYKQILSRREKEFYGLMDIDHYTFVPWKVVWREVANELDAAVVGSVRSLPVIPAHTIVLIPCTDGTEANYICALINSSPCRLAAQAYIVLHPDPHILDHIRIPRYDPNNPVHRELADLSRQAHVIVARGDTARLGQVEKKIDELAAHVWGLTESEMDAIRQSLQTTDSDENNDLGS